ncbi:MAG: hypothetical protein LBO72_11040 [Helicobacteraceae bacterium]|jgi:hypothetical protein|nr:hypothetical protein [Helicobacteraceae bacterium]
MSGIIITADVGKAIGTEAEQESDKKDRDRFEAENLRWETESDAKTLLAAAAIYKDKERLERALKVVDAQKELVDAVAENDEYLKKIGVK